MKFSEFLLFEKPMNYRTYAGVKGRLGTKAKIGFEFEIFVPSTTDLYVEQKERYSQKISWFDTIDEFEEVFDASRSTWQSIERDFQSWIDELEENHIDNTWEEHADDDTDEKEARKIAKDYFDRDEYEFKDWLKNSFDNNYYFVQNYGLEPKYGWANEEARYASVYIEELDEDNDSVLGTFERVRASLGGFIKQPIAMSTEYHGTKGKSGWRIEADGSIRSADGDPGHGVEIISPPLLLDDALKMLDEVFDWMDDNDVDTNVSTGLHINVSVPDMNNQIDPVKLVLFLGEKHLLAEFDRIANTYARPQLDYLVTQIRKNGKLPDSRGDDLVKELRSALSKDHYASINFEHLEGEDYIEFRAAGGDNYHRDPELVKKAIYRIVSVIEIACDPQAERQEYLKKLTQFVNKIEKSVLRITGTDIEVMKALPKQLHRLYKINSGILDMWERYAHTTSIEDKKSLLIYFTWFAQAEIKKLNTSLDLSEKVFLKKQLRDLKVTSEDIDNAYEGLGISKNSPKRLEFKKNFSL